MKAILLTIRLKYFYLTYKGIKTIEIRKSAPKDFVGDVYEVVSKTNFEKDLLEIPENEREFFRQFKGKVGLKFTLNKVEEIRYQRVFEDNPFHFLEEASGYGTDTLSAILLKKYSCLTDKELEQYLNTDKPNKHAYAWHISNLVIFDEQKELWQFKTPKEAIRYSKELNQAYKDDAHIRERLYEGLAEDNECANAVQLTELTEYLWGMKKAPQSWCYVDGTNNDLR